MSEPGAGHIRAVLDTNVLVRGLTRATGPSRQILEALVDARAFVLVTSTEISYWPSWARCCSAQRSGATWSSAISRSCAPSAACGRQRSLYLGAYVDLKAVPTDPDDDLPFTRGGLAPSASTASWASDQTGPRAHQRQRSSCLQRPPQAPAVRRWQKHIAAGWKPGNRRNSPDPQAGRCRLGPFETHR